MFSAHSIHAESRRPSGCQARWSTANCCAAPQVIRVLTRLACVTVAVRGPCCLRFARRSDYLYWQQCAELIKTELEKALGPTWHVIAGEHFGAYVAHEVGKCFYFSVGEMVAKHNTQYGRLWCRVAVTRTTSNVRVATALAALAGNTLQRSAWLTSHSRLDLLLLRCFRVCRKRSCSNTADAASDCVCLIASTVQLFQQHSQHESQIVQSSFFSALSLQTQRRRRPSHR